MIPNHVCICLAREAETNKQSLTKSYKKKKTDISCNSCRLWHWEERREQPGEGGEQLTRSDTGKRGDLIAQLAKSTGRKQQERLVSVWPCSLLLLVGPSSAFLFPVTPPNPVLLPPPPPPRPPSPHGRLSRLTASEQNDQLSSPLEHGSSW